MHFCHLLSFAVHEPAIITDSACICNVVHLAQRYIAGAGEKLQGCHEVHDMALPLCLMRHMSPQIREGCEEVCGRRSA